NDELIKSSKLINFVNSFHPIINSLKNDNLLSVNSYVLNYTSIVKSVIENKRIYKIGVMGIGTDFHTAGIFPNSKELFESKFNSLDYITSHTFGKSPYTNRITITIPALMLFDSFIIYLKSEEKKPVLDYLLEENTQLKPLNEIPCGVYRLMESTIVTDIIS
ncbi:MAG: 6-phosphogluconolactonase, partial [bacterium]